MLNVIRQVIRKVGVLFGLMVVVLVMALVVISAGIIETITSGFTEAEETDYSVDWGDSVLESMGNWVRNVIMSYVIPPQETGLEGLKSQGEGYEQAV